MSKDRGVLISRIDELVAVCGSRRAVALMLGIERSYLWRLHTGAKTDPSDKVLKKLGLKRTITFERIR